MYFSCVFSLQILLSTEILVVNLCRGIGIVSLIIIFDFSFAYPSIHVPSISWIFCDFRFPLSMINLLQNRYCDPFKYKLDQERYFGKKERVWAKGSFVISRCLTCSFSCVIVNSPRESEPVIHAIWSWSGLSKKSQQVLFTLLWRELDLQAVRTNNPERKTTQR